MQRWKKTLSIQAFPESLQLEKQQYPPANVQQLYNGQHRVIEHRRLRGHRHHSVIHQITSHVCVFDTEIWNVALQG